MPVTPLDPVRFPLYGIRLIEASAGTGKTYSLAALYVRLVLNHGGENAFGRTLLPPDILVVTFTEAATRELRDRIRQRLTQAAQCFRERADADPSDAFLQALLEDYEPDQWPGCADHLEAAAAWMDEAAIYTIHGFANRMLRQHAFDSGSLFNLELNKDEASLLEEAARDWWREHAYALDADQAAALQEYYATPDKLLSAVGPLLDKTAWFGAPDATAAALIDAYLNERQQTLNALKTLWAKWVDELRLLFEDAWKAEALPRSKPARSSDISKWLQVIADWAKSDEVQPKLRTTPFERLSGASIEQHQKEGADLKALINHQAWDHFQALAKVESSLPQLPEMLLPQAAHWIAQRLDAYKRRNGLLGFQDMLTRLRDALHSDSASQLAAVIGRQYPVALIDEFQDTDPVQYDIFEQIYASDRQPDERRAWIMIGDPKQAIYGFRGADVHTYLRARDRDQVSRYTLDANFRSAQLMVDAVNDLFNYAVGYDGGAFLMGNRIPYHPVTAQRGNQSLVVDDTNLAGMHCWLLSSDDPENPVLTTGSYQSRIAEVTASEICRLLTRAQAGHARLTSGAESTSLRPADIAILVRGWYEAELIRQALLDRNIRSVYLSDNDSVLNTAEAEDLLRWLQACAMPESERLLRAALATRSLGMSWQRLAVLTQDTSAWEDCVAQFFDYRQQWRARGVLPMLYSLLRDYQVPARLLSGDDDRGLTNLLHLAELLQTAAGQLDGEQALVRWLRDSIAEADSAARSNEQILRLESDADLIKVITIHKSKGLEYPLVFLPFACSFKEVEQKQTLIRYVDDAGQLQFSLKPDAPTLARAEQERLAEDLRLLYVALTRARVACWLGIAPLKPGGGKGQVNTQLHQSALGYLLNGGETIAVDQLADLLDAQATSPGIRVLTAPEPDCQRYNALRTADDKLAEARVYTGPKPEPWWIASYSALSPIARDPDSAPPATLRDEQLLDEAGSEPQTETFREDPAAGHHGFVRGPIAGTFLHGLLEEAARFGFDRALAGDGDQQALHSDLRQLVHNRARLRGWSRWADLLETWLTDLLRCSLPLSEPAPRLCDLAQGHYLAEPEFLFQANQVDTTQLDKIVSAGVQSGSRRPALKPEQLNGMLKGFIDLVFTWQGRYYVLDYKSNWLGANDDAYQADNMTSTVLEKRQDIQLSLYLLALHRLLRARLGEQYDIHTHLGGGALFYLRGLHSPTRGVHLQSADPDLIEALDALFASQEAAHA
jgi:exodeoxyribonuclease V beta subunit